MYSLLTIHPLPTAQNRVPFQRRLQEVPSEIGSIWTDSSTSTSVSPPTALATSPPHTSYVIRGYKLATLDASVLQRLHLYNVRIITVHSEGRRALIKGVGKDVHERRYRPEPV
jgi:hypothetical protein